MRTRAVGRNPSTYHSENEQNAESRLFIIIIIQSMHSYLANHSARSTYTKLLNTTPSNQNVRFKSVELIYLLEPELEGVRLSCT